MFGFRKNKKQYILVERKMDSEHYRQGVKVTQGKYKDTIFTIGPQVKLIPTENGDTFTLSFDYNVERKSQNVIDEDYYSSDFEKVVGDIIIDIIDTNNQMVSFEKQ